MLTKCEVQLRNVRYNCEIWGTIAKCEVQLRKMRYNCEIWGTIAAIFKVALFLRAAWLMVVPTVWLFVKSHCTASFEYLPSKSGSSSIFCPLDKIVFCYLLVDWSNGGGDKLHKEDTMGQNRIVTGFSPWAKWDGALQYHTIPHNTIPHHTIPHNTIPQHTIPQ